MRKFISKYKYLLLISLAIVLVLICSIYIFDKHKLYQIGHQQIAKSCLEAIKNVNGLDCSKLEFDNLLENIIVNEVGYDGPPVFKGWVVTGGVRNDNDEFIWDSNVELDSSGKVLSEGFGYREPPKDADLKMPSVQQ